MRRLGRFRVPLFVELLTRPIPLSAASKSERDIVRRPGNPLLRYAAPTAPVPPTQEALL